MWTYIIFTITIVGVGGISDTKKCVGGDPFEKCPLDITRIPIARTLDDIHQYFNVCETLDDFHNCYYRNQENISLDVICNPLFTTLVTSQKMIYDLCSIHNSTKFNPDFYKYVKCYRKRNDDLRACSRHSEKIVPVYLNLLKELGESMEPPARFIICLKMKHKMDCLTKKILRACGVEAEKIFVKFLGGMHFMQMYCTQSELEHASEIIKIVGRVKDPEWQSILTVYELLYIIRFF